MRKSFVLSLLVLAAGIVFSISQGEMAEAKRLVDSNASCANLSDDQLELIGEYIMELMHPGEAHELMHKMMGLAEGTPQEKAFHISMAKSMYCGEAGYGMMGMMGMGSGMMGYGMMGPGGMMGYWNASAQYAMGSGMMGYGMMGPGGMMGGWGAPSWISGYGTTSVWSILAIATWLLIILDLILLAAYLFKSIAGKAQK